jgi:hypothetical protein
MHTLACLKQTRDAVYARLRTLSDYNYGKPRNLLRRGDSFPYGNALFPPTVRFPAHVVDLERWFRISLVECE